LAKEDAEREKNHAETVSRNRKRKNDEKRKTSDEKKKRKTIQDFEELVDRCGGDKAKYVEGMRKVLLEDPGMNGKKFNNMWGGMKKKLAIDYFEAIEPKGS